MSQCIVPSWNLRPQRQEQVEGEERHRSSHVHSQLQNPITTTPLIPNPMSNCEVAELTWENGQVAMHGLGGLIYSVPTKPTWACRSGETLESIVHQATHNKQNLNTHQPQGPQHDRDQKISAASKSCNINVTSSIGKWTDTSSGHRVQMVPLLPKRHPASESTGGVRIVLDGSSHHLEQEHVNISACASANGTYCKDNDTATMTWASLDSNRSMKTKTTEDDTACHLESGNQDDDRETKTETTRSHSSRRIRAAAIHNQSERKRRHRINQKMKALQKLVPNASKTDKASMLDEVIEYLKQLQAQVQMMSAVRNMTPLMLPLGMQQYLQQMCFLARMGMAAGGLGMGIGMLDMSTVARGGGPPQSLSPFIRPTPTSVAAAAPAFVHPPFLVPPMIPSAGPAARPDPVPAGNNASAHLSDPYCALLAQSMNMDYYNKMASLYQEQVNQTTQAVRSRPSEPKHAP